MAAAPLALPLSCLLVRLQLEVLSSATLLLSNSAEAATRSQTSCIPRLNLFGLLPLRSSLWSHPLHALPALVERKRFKSLYNKNITM